MALKDQQVAFEYLEWQDLYEEEKPFEVFIQIPDGLPDARPTNLVFNKVCTQLVKGIRGNESEYTLNEHGFQVVKAPTAFKDFYNRDSVEQHYKAECAQLLMDNLEGVDRLYFFNWRVGFEQKSKRTIDLNNPLDSVVPAVYPHVDESTIGSIQRVYQWMKDEAEDLLKGRVGLISIWRPLRLVEDWPLAVCDGRTIKEHDLVASDNIRRNYVGENLFARYSPNYRWHYLSNQEKDEVFLLKIYDSKPDVIKYYAHAAFRLSDPPPDAAPRESIELRAIIFTKPEI